MRGSIEIAKCAIFRTNCATLNVTNSSGNPRIRADLVWILRDGDRFATLFECSPNFPSASYLDIQCMHSSRMNQGYINIIRNRFIAKTLRCCNGPTIGIKGNKPREKNMIKNKTTTKQNKKKKKIIQRKIKQLRAESPTYTICTEGRLRDHCATLPRITLSRKIIIII